MAKGINLNNLKNQNRSSLLYLLNTYGELSRKELSKKLNLTPAAITKIVQELIESNDVKEGLSISKGLGRKEVLVSLNLEDKLLYGLNVEMDHITLSFSTFSGKLIKRKNIPFSNDFTYVIKEAKDYYLLNNINVQVISLCIIGNLDGFGVYKDIDYQKILEETFNKKVIVSNNVKAFATAGLIFDNKKEEDSLLFFKWGPGIGSSIVSNGKVVTGNDYSSTEIGHYIIHPLSEKKCRCGRKGCLETEVSLKEILNQVKQSGKDLTIEEILESKDEEIIKLIDSKINLSALALVNTATILNVHDIVLFGSMFNNPTFAEKFISKCLQLNPTLTKENIRVSALNSSSGYIGACAIAAQQLFFEKGI